MASHAHSSAGWRRHPQTDTVLAVCVAGSLRAHERWDGKGYPDGLRGEAIPIEGRNVTVADVYNALVVNRVYRHGFERAKAHQILNSGVGCDLHSSPAPIDYPICPGQLEEFRVGFILEGGEAHSSMQRRFRWIMT